MELSPRDLGNERYLSVLRKRLTPMTAQNGTPPTDVGPRSLPHRRIRRGRRLRRYWVRDLNLDEATGEETASLLWHGTPGVGMRVGSIILSMYALIGTLIAFAIGGGGILVGMSIILFWALLLSVMATSPRKTIKQLDSKPLTVTEVESLLPTARGRLERSYLNLVLDALRQDAPSVSAQSDVRAALRYLGDAVSKLPADASPAVDPLKLRAEASERRRTATGEADVVVRASLLREAEALERRAAVGEQNQSARRASALRREVRAQMDALRAVLVAYNSTNQTDTTSVAHLAESIQRAASEAQAAALARRELEDDEIQRLFGASLPPQTANAPVAQTPATQVPTTAPQTTPTTQAAPQQQTVSRGAWWRNGGS